MTTQNIYDRKIVTRATERSAKVVKNLSGGGGGSVTDPLEIDELYAADAVRVAGVEFIVSSTKPTTRKDGDTLVVDDIWYDTATNTEWFWNGTLWLSRQQHFINSLLSFASATASSVSIERLPLMPTSRLVNFFLETMTWNTQLAFADGTNYWSIQAQCLFANNTVALVSGSTAVNLQALSATNSGSQTLNLVVQNNNSNVPLTTLNAALTKFGTAANLNGFVITFAGRMIAP